MMKTRVIFLLSIVVFAIPVGCNNGPARPDGLPPLQPCKFSVIQDGKPLAEAVVKLVSVDKSSNWIISGRTDATGVAKMTTQMSFDGVPEGKYKVLVSKYVTEGAPQTVPVNETDQPQETLSYPTYSHIPGEFDSFDKTPFEITVSKGKNEETFDVGKAVRIEIK